MKVLDFIAISLVVWTLIALPFVLLNWFFYIYRRHAKGTPFSRPPTGNKPPAKSTRAFLIPIVALFTVCFLSESAARDQVRHRVNSLSPGYTVSVNGIIIQNSEDVLYALGDLHWRWAHHSHPTKKISVVISDESGRIALTLSRDSEYPQEYWVFLPNYWITSRDEIGRIKTSAFDNY